MSSSRSSPGPRWPEPSFLRCCRALSDPARLYVSSHHDPTQQLRFLCWALPELDIIFTRDEERGSHQQCWAERSIVLAPGAGAGPGGVTSPGSWEQGQGKPRRPSYYIQCRAERSVRALAALIPLPGRQPRRSSELRILLWGSEEAGTGAASLLPRTTKKNAEVGAALLCRALYGPQCPESSSYPLASQSLKDRTVSWVGPNSEEVTNCLPTLEKLLSTRQKTSHVENGSV